MDEEIINISQNKPKYISKTGKFLLVVTGGLGIGISIICASFLSPALRKHCLPFVPATSQQIQNVLKGVINRKGRLLDIGSGDGRIVIAAAKNGFHADGVELNPWLVMFSKICAFKHNVHNLTNFYKQDLWKFPLTPYKNIVIFGVEEMMFDVEDKIVKEVQSDTIVVACRFPFPNITPECVIGEGIDTVWIYRITKPKNS